MHEPIPFPIAARPPHGPAARDLAARIRDSLPPTFVHLWSQSERGTLIVAEGERPHYASGHFYWRHAQGNGALYLPPTPSLETLWTVVGAWLDHFAGSFATGARLSDGIGATPRLADAAQHFLEIVALGHAAPALETDTPGQLLPKAIAAWHTDQHHLSSADPVLTRWLRSTLFDEGMWRAVAEEIDGR